MRSSLALVLGFCLGLTGCSRAPSDAPPAAPIPVTVSYPVEREVTDYADFTARTASVDSVEVRARVWGYLDKVNFKEGALVKKGDVLFQIDPRTYRAALAQAEGNLASMQSRVRRLDADLHRRQVAFRLGQGRPIGARVDLEQHIPLLDVGALDIALLDEVARDLGLDPGVHVAVERCDPGHAERDVLRHDVDHGYGGGRRGRGGRSVAASP